MHRASIKSLAPLLLVGVSLTLASCAAGPDFNAPNAPDVSSYDNIPALEKTADGAQQLRHGQDIPAQWWKLFHADSLNKLVEQAIKDNPDLEAADASLRVAEDNLAAAGAYLFPSVDANFSSQRERTARALNNGTSKSQIYTIHNASVSVTYALDVFGGTRRAIEELQAEADYTKYQREAAYLALTTNVVTAAIQEASLREQISATQKAVNDQEKILHILQARFEAGAVAKSTVLAQQSILATTRAQLPPLQHQLVVTRHLLTALLGQLPVNEPATKFTLASLTLPAEVPLSLPSRLVEQRPDIRAARENLHAASAAIGIAVAQRLPQISLSADIGTMATVFDKLFGPGSAFWNIGANVSEKIFDAGALADKEQAARDTYDIAAAQYRKTVLAAFQDVADTLHALQSDAETLNARVEAEKAASASLALAQTQLAAGAVSTADWLVAEQAQQQALAALAQAKAQRFADTAALLAALGGGWWNRDVSDKGAI